MCGQVSLARPIKQLPGQVFWFPLYTCIADSGLNRETHQAVTHTRHPTFSESGVLLGRLIGQLLRKVVWLPFCGHVARFHYGDSSSSYLDKLSPIWSCGKVLLGRLIRQVCNLVVHLCMFRKFCKVFPFSSSL